jgi:hypothetical protein
MRKVCFRDCALCAAVTSPNVVGCNNPALGGGESVVDAAVTGSGLRWDTFEDHVRGMSGFAS